MLNCSVIEGIPDKSAIASEPPPLPAADGSVASPGDGVGVGFLVLTEHYNCRVSLDK